MGLTDTSKFLSLILRHKPETIGIKLDEHGWADVSELISGISKTRPFDMKMLEEIVRTDNKQRYSFNEDKTLIRANQGHSIPVDVELEKKTPPEFLYHGTGEKFVSSIDKEGLLSKSRYMFIYQRILIQQLRWAAGMESLWCIGWQPERWQMTDMSFLICKWSMAYEAVPAEYLSKL